MRARAIGKRAGYLLAGCVILPVVGSFWIRARLLGRDRAILASSEALALIPGLLGQYLRKAFYGRTLTYCHPSVAIEFGTIFSKANARLEENVYIGPMCHIGSVHIGRDSLLAAGVHVPSGPLSHGMGDLRRPIREQPGEARMISIGAGCWIGAAAIVLADVGRDTVVAAGSVVTRPLPDRVVAGGVPARVIRSRAGDHEVEEMTDLANDDR